MSVITPRRVAGVALLAVPEAALVAAWAVGVPLFAVVMTQLIVLVGYGLLAAIATWRNSRRAHLHSVHQSAALAERARLAAEMHDLLGHRLALLALKAGALQLATHGEAQRTAAEVRSGVDSAINELAQTIAVLGDNHEHGPPATANLSALLDRARAAGMTITLAGDDDLFVEVPPLGLGVVREGLTNAARHATGQPVSLRIAVRDGALRLRLDNPMVSAPPTPGAGTGLTTLRRRLQAQGGDLTNGVTGNTFRLSATVPMTPSTVAAWPSTAMRSPTGIFVRRVWIPVLVTTAVVLGFHLWATTGATMEPAQFAAIRSGQPVENLPPRQAPVRLLSAPDPPANANCRQYTDGSFPLAYATFEVCLSGATVMSTTDLRRLPLW